MRKEFALVGPQGKQFGLMSVFQAAPGKFYVYSSRYGKGGKKYSGISPKPFASAALAIAKIKKVQAEVAKGASFMVSKESQEFAKVYHQKKVAKTAKASSSKNTDRFSSKPRITIQF